MPVVLSKRFMWLKLLVLAIAGSGLLFFFLRSKLAPPQQNDLCALFTARPSWYHSAHASQTHWKVPVSVQMAIMHQESHFRADVQPGTSWFPFFNHTSSARGYAQVLDSTWQSYLSANHLKQADRSNFASASDFMGWYLHQLSQQLNIPPTDAYRLYLAYHEGKTGYRKQHFKQKLWLQRVASRVSHQAQQYHQQLVVCSRSMRQLSS